jgi:predicted TIM-barrel fold metal-dependent hydrolase
MLKNLPEKRRNESEEWYKKAWNAPLENYLKEAEDAGVDKGILNAVRFPFSLGVITPNDWLAEQGKKFPDRIEWACGVNPVDLTAAREVERCVKELGAIAVGELGSCYEYYYVNDIRNFPFYEKCIELDVPIIHHCSTCGPETPTSMMKYGDLVNVDEVAIKYPELKIVIAHMGVSSYRTCVELMCKHKNIFADISAMAWMGGLNRAITPKYLPFVECPFFSYLEPILLYFSQTSMIGGTDKLIWGSDWVGGNGTLVKQEVDAVSRINPELRKIGFPEIPEKSLHNILHENWKKVFTKLADKLGTTWGDGK